MVMAHTTLTAVMCAGIDTLDQLWVSFNYCKMILPLESMINSNPTTSEDGKVSAVCSICGLGALCIHFHYGTLLMDSVDFHSCLPSCQMDNKYLRRHAVPHSYLSPLTLDTWLSSKVVRNLPPLPFSFWGNLIIVKRILFHLFCWLCGFIHQK